MKLRNALALGAVLLMATIASLPAFTEEDAPEPVNPSEWWQKMATPGANHRWLDFMVGSWTTDSKFWQGPGEPVTSQGKAGTRWALGEHYLRSDYKGDMMGMPFAGELTVAYDNATQRYQQVWIDNMSTGIMVSMGEREGDVLTLMGDAVTHMGTFPKRDVITKVSDDEYTHETFWAMPNIGDFKVMELRYKRAE